MPELGGSLIWAMPESMRLFSADVFPYGAVRNHVNNDKNDDDNDDDDDDYDDEYDDDDDNDDSDDDERRAVG